jgi:hypothetical protein
VSRKIATITAAVWINHDTHRITARGRGRSARTAATRALLNLLKQQPFRRQSVVQAQIELSIVNSAQGSISGADRDSTVYEGSRGRR